MISEPLEYGKGNNDIKTKLKLGANFSCRKSGKMIKGNKYILRQTIEYVNSIKLHKCSPEILNFKLSRESRLTRNYRSYSCFV